MNLVILSPKDILGLNHGAARRIYNLANNVVKLGNKVTVICISNFHERRMQIVRPKRNLNLISVSFGEVVHLVTVIVRHLISADIVQLEFPTFSPLIPVLKKLGKPIVLDEHGVEVEFMNEVCEALERRVKKFEYVKTRLLESLGVKTSSTVFVCSDIDGEKIQREYKIPDSKVVTIPNGVDENFLERVDAYNYDKPTILFVGSFDHAPNIYAARVLLNEIIPAVCGRVKDAMFAFVGRNPPLWIIENSFKTSTRIFGNVKDVRPFIAGADVAVAPIYHGSGTRIKILEYMALGKPVVSTSKGVEGLDVKDEESVLIRDDYLGFAEAIIRLLCDRNSAIRIGQNGEKLVREKYVWKKIAMRAMEVYENL